MIRIVIISVLTMMHFLANGQELFKDEKSRSYGLKDARGNIIVKPKYVNFNSTNTSDYFPVAKGYGKKNEWGIYAGEKWGVIDATGKEVVPFKYDNMEGIQDKLIVVKLQDKYGIIDVTGKEVFPFKYDMVYYFNRELGTLGVGKKEGAGYICGVVDLTDKIIMPFQYANLDIFSDGYRKTVKELAPNVYKFGIIEESGKEIIPPQCDQIYNRVSYYEGGGLKYHIYKDIAFRCTLVKFNCKLTPVSLKTGEDIISEQYDKVSKFSDSLIWVSNGNYPNERSGLIDISGNVVLPLMCTNIEYPIDNKKGVAKVTAIKNNKIKTGFIDKNGNEVIPIQYDYFGDLREEMRGVCIDGKCGYIDVTGKTMIPLQFELAENFVNGKAVVSFSGNVIDKTGNIIEKGTKSLANLTDEERSSIITKKRATGVNLSADDLNWLVAYESDRQRKKEQALQERTILLKEAKSLMGIVFIKIKDNKPYKVVEYGGTAENIYVSFQTLDGQSGYYSVNLPQLLSEYRYAKAHTCSACGGKGIITRTDTYTYTHDRTISRGVKIKETTTKVSSNRCTVCAGYGTIYE